MIKKLKQQIEDFKNKSPTEQIYAVLPYLLVSLLCIRICELWRLSGGSIESCIRYFDYIYSGGIHTSIQDLLYGTAIGCGITKYYQWNLTKNIKKTRKGEEYGSARWGTAKDIAPYIDPNPFYNIILSKTERLTMNPKMKIFKHNRNKHVAVFGGSGSGKTYGFVKPNLFQAHSSYVLTDPKGTLLAETGHLFEKLVYRIKVLDTIDFNNSMHYNPFVYINQPKDILTLATTLQKNLKDEEGNKGGKGDDFFDKAALLWMQATIGLLWYEAPKEEQNINSVLEILEADEVMEGDENYKNAVDLLFEELEKKNPKHFAVKQRKKYKKAAGKTAKSILITLGAMFSAFDIPEVAELMSYDELEIDTYGNADQKTILYVIISDTDDSFNFIPAIMFTQMFNVLCYKADKEMGGKLKTPVQFILDEFANIGQIPKFQILIATIRSRLMSVILLLQTKSQLKERYGDAAETILGNCDSYVFLGGQEQSTLKELEELLGEETIDLWNDSRTYGQSESTSVNSNKVGRKLKNTYELSVMERDQCIVRISGLPPFCSEKYDATSHPNFKYTGDADEKYMFDFKKYRERIKEKESNHIRFKSNDLYQCIRRKSS